MMKAFVRSILILLIFDSYALAATRYVGDDYTLIYAIQDSNGDHVTGESPTLRIRRNSDGYYYDFNDSSFKNSGWTTKQNSLSEDSTDGFYYSDWTPPGSETSGETYLFLVDNADTNGYGDHQAELVTYLTKPVHPTVAGRSIDVTSGGTVGIDWANVETPTSTVALSGTTISSTQQVASVAGAVGSVTGNVGGNVAGSVASVTNAVTVGTLQAAALADLFDTDSGSTYSSAVAGSPVKEIADNAGGGASAADVADAVWDEALADHVDAGSAGKKLGDLPESGTGDWTPTEKVAIKGALSVSDDTVESYESLGEIGQKVRTLRR